MSSRTSPPILSHFADGMYRRLQTYYPNVPDNTHFSFHQGVNLKPCATYQLVLWARTDVPGACSFDAVSLGGMSTELTNKQWTSDWSQKTAMFQTPPDMTSGQLVISGGCVSALLQYGKLYIDDITLTEQS